MKTNSVYIIFALVCVIGLCVLQYYISLKSKKWLGWILPGIFFCLSILFTISAVTFLHSYEISEVYSNNGNLMSSIITNTTSNFSIQTILPKAIEIFLICNLPTILFIIIFLVVHQKQKREAQIHKMNIQDL